MGLPLGQRDEGEDRDRSGDGDESEDRDLAMRKKVTSS
jgi:hypothetical protein